MLKHRLPRILLGTCVLAVVLLHVTRTVPLQVIDAMENFAYDTRVRITAPGMLDDRIVIVDIDEASLREQGQWPWPRTKLKTLMDALFDTYRVAMVAFDVVFAEEDENWELRNLKQLLREQNEDSFVEKVTQLEPLLNRDRIFANALSGRPVVLGYYFNINPETTTSHGVLPEPTFESEGLVNTSFYPPQGFSYGSNIEILQSSAAGAGFFSNPLLDSDGIVRRVPMLHGYEDGLYESLSLSVVRTYFDEVVVPILADGRGTGSYPALEALSVGDLFIPIDVNGAALVPYRGRKGSFPYVSATDVLNTNAALEDDLRGKIILIGTSALGLADLRATPIQAAFPGVEIHANVISGILDQSLRHRPAWTWGAEIAAVLVVGVVLIIASPFVGPLSLSLVALALLVPVSALNLYLWQSKNLVLPIASVLLTIAGIYVTAVIHGFFSESRAQKRIRHAFNHYMAPALVKRLVDDPRQLRLSGETREMTFLFSDLVGFTALTERSDAETLVRVLNEYLDGMCQIVMDQGGTIDKIVGDAIYAIWNAPLDQPDHASRAVQCSLALDEFCVAFAAKQKQDDIHIGGTRLGVNTGTAVIGNFGGSQRFDYTAYGDPINIASRLENANRHLGTRICVAGTTVAQCPHLSFRPIGTLTVKGKTVAVDVYEPLTAEEAKSERVADYLAAFALLKDGSDRVLSEFEGLMQKYPGDPLVALHHRRLTRGETGTQLVLTQK